MQAGQHLAGAHGHGAPPFPMPPHPPGLQPPGLPVSSAASLLALGHGLGAGGHLPGLSKDIEKGENCLHFKIKLLSDICLHVNQQLIYIQKLAIIYERLFWLYLGFSKFLFLLFESIKTLQKIQCNCFSEMYIAWYNF